MSLTAVAVFLIFLVGLALGFILHPVFALLSYFWIFYLHPGSHWWGEGLPDLRLSLLAACVAIISVFFRSEKTKGRWLSSYGSRILLAYTFWMWLQLGWAISYGVQLDGAILWTKYLMLHYVVFKIVNDEAKAEIFFWAQIVGCFIFGWAAFRTDVSGRLESVGGPGVDDANLLAAHLIPGLAIAGFMFLGQSGVKRWLAFLTIPFILNAIILTQSRGALVSMALSAPVAWYLAPKSCRKSISVAILLGGLLFLGLSNEEFWERAASLAGGKEQAAEETRVGLIKPQLRMAEDYPLGAGHRGNEFLSPIYMPSELLSNSGNRSAHNTFLAVLVDQGIPGAILLIALYLWAVIQVVRLRNADQAKGSLNMAALRAGLGTALFSYFISGIFLNLLKAEGQIWYIAVLASMTCIREQQTKLQQKK